MSAVRRFLEGEGFEVRGAGRLRERQALAAVEADKERREDRRRAAGAEARPAAFLALRLGRDGRSEAGPGVTGGRGAGADALWFDCAFMPFGARGSAPRAAITFRRGRPA